jgi:heat-inducible transcriptional repressor
MPAELTERRQLILKLVVQEFVASALPVASKVLVERYLPGYSSATIRNELAALEELGYLTHRHTSDGRIPTDAGYRYYVENLMERTPLSPAEQRTIRHQFYQVRSEQVDQWIHLAGAVLARTSQNASVVTPPRSFQARLKHTELIGIHDSTALLILVFHDGSVKQQTLALETARSQEELRRLSSRLNERCADATVARVEELLRAERLAPEGDELELTVLELMAGAMRQLEAQMNEQIHSDGLIEVLSQPEFAKVQRVRQLIEILQGGKGLGPLIPQVLARDGVQVVIGGEHGKDEMREYSVVLSRYGVDGIVTGVLGIIGPTRMAYPRSISTVGYISTVMSDLLSELYGADSAR